MGEKDHPQEEIEETEGTTRLLSRLRYEKKVEKAMKQVFGRVLLCRSLEGAGRLARQHNLICVTPDGDQINRRGVLTGGFHDVRRSRLEMMKQIRKAKDRFQLLSDDSLKLKTIVRQKDEEISNLSNDLHLRQTTVQQMQDDLEQLRFEVRSCRRQLSSLSDSLTETDRQLSLLSFDIRRSKESLDLLTAELNSDFLAELSPSERDDLLQATQKLSDTQTAVLQSSLTRSKVLFSLSFSFSFSLSLHKTKHVF